MRKTIASMLLAGLTFSVAAQQQVFFTGQSGTFCRRGISGTGTHVIFCRTGEKPAG